MYREACGGAVAECRRTASARSLARLIDTGCGGERSVSGGALDSEGAGCCSEDDAGRATDPGAVMGGGRCTHLPGGGAGRTTIVAAASRLQRAWRGRGAMAVVTSIEAGWDAAAKRRHGSLVAHVRFLQYAFRATRALRAGCWAMGRLRAPFIALRLLWRDGPVRRCGGGVNLVTQEERTAQRRLAGRMLDWYAQYVAVLRRLESGVTPRVVHAFCGGGGDTEGVHRANGSGVGIDDEAQPDFARRFGREAFVQGDATSWAELARLRDRHGAFGCMAGPPCKFYSTARVHGESSAPPLIAATRDALETCFEEWSLENVMGARTHLRGSVTELRGSDFGLAVDRPRLFETSFPLRMDACVRQPAERLRRGSCLGARRRWRAFDTFGRPSRRPCCAGNLFAVQGTTPWRCTVEECAAAMGVDAGHMSYERLAQSVPPAYGQLVFAQMCMWRAHRRYGVPVVSFDDLEADPVRSRRTLARWLHGAGDERPEVAVELLPAIASSVEQTVDSTAACAAGIQAGVGDAAREVVCDFPTNASAREPAEGRAIDQALSLARRELFYSHAGGFDQRWSPGRPPGAHWLDELKPAEALGGGVPAREQLSGHNTLIEVSRANLQRIMPLLEWVAREAAAGTRVAVIAPAKHESWLRRHGLVLVDSSEGAQAAEAAGVCLVCAGRRGGGTRESYLDHAWARQFMDARDQGAGLEPKELKERRAWTYYEWDPRRWEGKGMQPAVERLMTRGATIELDADVGAFEVRQYPWPSQQALVEGILEADRSLAVGAMEYVPAGEVESVLRECVVHPWTVVQQGAEKWRACHDYSVGTNRAAASAPFELPTTWDVLRIVKPTTHFVKYDLRDGFYAVPVEPGSRRRLVMRHPGTGRLLQCARLPFGYVDSPRLFCSVTEAIAGELRKRAAGMGIGCMVFVDDFLCWGDTEELARRAGEMLEAILAEFGLEWAPHKQRGPTQCIEFLGLLVCNVPGARCIALTEERQRKVRALIDEWQARKPRAGRLRVVDPTELARLLGNLVFASQCVPGGRTYMQGMLSQFRGLEVDWRHGKVRLSRGGGAPREMTVDGAFWRDLEWFDDHFERRNCVSMEQPTHGEAAITGTDASDWGTGQLAWLDGAREEVQLRFTEVERRRSINWRELLGIVRVFESFGERLSGRLVLVETDNMAAKGAASKLASNAPDMQELLRRLLEEAARHGITLRFTHTPGVKLCRPDQTSRGDPVEVPRMRVLEEEFRTLEARFGPFNEMVGAERAFGSWTGEAAAGMRLWMHPTYNTVGSALRLLGERLGGANGERASGVVIVPHDESAAWWGLTRHFQVVGRWAAGTACLEANALGRWRRVRALRDTLVLAFPRGAGGVVRPVWLGPSESYGTGYVLNPERSAKVLPLPAGAFVYSAGERPGTHGVLYQVWRRFDPRRAERMYLEEASDVQAVQAAQLTRSQVSRGRGAKKLETEGGRAVYSLNLQRDSDTADRAFAPGIGYTPWAVEATLLYCVDHLVKELPRIDGKNLGSEGVGRSGSLMAKAEAARRFVFDYKQAEREVVRVVGRRLHSEHEAGAAAVAAADEVVEVTSSETAAAQPAPSPVVEGLRRSRRGRGEAPLGEVMRSPQRMEAKLRAAKRRDLSGAVDELAALDLSAELAPDAAMAAAAELCKARQSAEEAAAARARPPQAPVAAQGTQGARERVPPSSMDGRQQCKYAGMRCAGCGGAFTLGQWMVQGGCGMVHEDGSCRELAERDLDEAARLQIEKRGAKAAASGVHSEKREAQLKHRFSEPRLAVARCCLEGRCSVTDERERRVFCVRGCGRGVHVVACLGMSSHRARLGALVCSECRAAEMAPYSCTPPTALASAALVSMLLEMSTGAEGTAAGYSDYARLERQWVAHVSGEALADGGIVLPRHSEESFISFLGWLATDADRARSFGTIVRAAGGVLERLELTNWTKTSRVKAVVKELEQSRGVEGTPDTHATRRILGLLMGKTLSEHCGPALLTRSKVQVVLELMGGVRVGEATGGGDGHGALADNVCIARPAGTNVGDAGEVVELWLEDSKTGFARYVDFVGKSQGALAIEGAQLIRELWKESGVQVTEKIEDGMIVERPDYSVVRVSLVDMSDEVFEKFIKAVVRTRDGAVATHAKATVAKARQRRAATTKGEEHRYINIAGGARDGSSIKEAMAWLQSHGLAAYADVVKGPLLRATHGRLLTHMPLAPDSSYTHIMGALRDAYLLSSEMEEPDLELDLAGLEEPKWGHHSLRRTADKIARDTMAMTGADKGDIDDMFGWKQKERKKDQQLAYAGLRDRVHRARITMMI